MLRHVRSARAKPTLGRIPGVPKFPIFVPQGFPGPKTPLECHLVRHVRIALELGPTSEHSQSPFTPRAGGAGGEGHWLRTPRASVCRTPTLLFDCAVVLFSLQPIFLGWMYGCIP